VGVKYYSMYDVKLVLNIIFHAFFR